MIFKRKKPLKPHRNLEEGLQTQCVTWFRMVHKSRIIFSIPNGGGKISRITGAILKRSGLLRGVPDLFIPEPVNQYSGLFIEMKSEKGVTSPEQKQLIGQLKNRGYYVEVVKSFDSFMNLVNNYLKGEL